MNFMKTILNGIKYWTNEKLSNVEQKISKVEFDLEQKQPIGNYVTRDYVDGSIPTDISAFNNDAGYITKDEVPEGFSGSWNDLTDKPFGEEGEELVFFDGEVYQTDYDYGYDRGNTNFNSNQPLYWEKDYVLRLSFKYNDSNEVREIILKGENYESHTFFIDNETCDVLLEMPKIGSKYIFLYSLGGNFPTCAVKATLSNKTIATIDEKFIPDSIARVVDCVKSVNGSTPDENGNVEIDIPEGFSGSWNDLTDKPFGEQESLEHLFTEKVTKECLWVSDIRVYPNTKYLVRYDGIEYVAQSRDSDYECMIGARFNSPDENSDYPFSITYMYQDDLTNIYVVNDGVEHTLEIYEYSMGVKLLEEKYLPDSVARTADLHIVATNGNYNDLNNVPVIHKVDFENIDVDLNKFITRSDGKLEYIVYDKTGLGNLIFNYGTTHTVCTDGMMGINAIERGDERYEGIYDITIYGNANLLMGDKEDTGEDFCLFSGYDIVGMGSNIYGIILSESATMCYIEVTQETLKQLDEKFLPTTVPVISTAQVGQAVVVKAVDERSIPTEWEAMDIKAYIHEAIYGIIDGSIENISNNKALYVRDYAFYQHENLIAADFSSATSVGNYSFYKCPALTTVDIPQTINIGTFAFKGCSALVEANYPLATTVSNGAFDECTTLSSVNLPLLTTVEPLTFRKCEALTTIDLPVATTIKTQAFYSSGLTSLTLRSNTVCTLENVDALTFTPIEEGTGYIYVPSNLVDSYKTASGWSEYANQIKAIV